VAELFSAVGDQVCTNLLAGSRGWQSRLNLYFYKKGRYYRFVFTA